MPTMRTSDDYARDKAIPRTYKPDTETLEIPTETVSCPACNSVDWIEYARYMDLDFKVPGIWRLVKCVNCQLIYMNPRPTSEAFHLIYPANYVPYQMDLRPDTRWLMKKAILTAYEGAKLRELERVSMPSKPRILDVGCGAGFFLTLLRERGWAAIGVEPNRDLVERAKSELGLDVRLGTLETADLGANSFDVITLWHALEHDPSPRHTLALCYQLLKPGGAVLVQVPDNASWEAKHLGNYYWSNDIPRHLNFFTRTTLAQMARLEHFSAEDIHRTKNATSWLWTFLRWVNWDLYAQMERNIGKISLLYLIVAPFYYLFSKGDWITAVLRKS